MGSGKLRIASATASFRVQPRGKEYWEEEEAEEQHPQEPVAAAARSIDKTQTEKPGEEAVGSRYHEGGWNCCAHEPTSD